MKLDAAHRHALSEVDGPLRDALERVFLEGVPKADIAWFRRSPHEGEPVRLVVQGREVWCEATGWIEGAEKTMRHAAGKS